MKEALPDSAPCVRITGQTEACRDVILALAPAVSCAVYFCGWCAVWLVVTCVSAAVASEAAWRKVFRRACSLGDFSAVVTGLLLALCLPPDLPLWMAALGALFAIGVAKLPFGGRGYNPFNPALSGYVFLLLSFPHVMTTWRASMWSVSAGALDALTTATPLTVLKHGGADLCFTHSALLEDLFFGMVNGALGETSAFALVVGAIYLLVRRVITWQAPVAFLGTVFLCAWIQGAVPSLVQILAGGTILGACFMATDPVTSPSSMWGRLVFGAGCGVLTIILRTLPGGHFPEGVAFAILLMNAFTPIINRWIR